MIEGEIVQAAIVNAVISGISEETIDQYCEDFVNDPYSLAFILDNLAKID